MIAGLDFPSQGQILLKGQDVTALRPAMRDIGFVFQFYALYPHMSVLENLIFPLINSGWAQDKARERARSTAKELGLSSFLEKKPRTLSGGDQQRVGLARAMVRQPALYLMDEPLGTLDQALREEIREYLKERQAREPVTTIYVTHDQEEAMALADRVVVMEGGLIRQAAPPSEVYDRPADLFTAHFLGSPGMNFLKDHYKSQIANNKEGKGMRESAILGIRPEFIRIDARGDLEARVIHDASFGSYRLLYADSLAGRLVCRTGPRPPLAPGAALRLRLDPGGLRSFDRGTGKLL
jgi:ABC-type sugar transport system ATPase subunit